MKAIFQAWDRFFFMPTFGLTLGVFRFLFGIVVFISVLGVFPARATFYGPDAIVSPEMGQKAYSAYWSILGFNFLPLSEPGMTIFFGLLMSAALMLSVGIFTRIANLVVFLGLFSLNNRNPYNVNAGDLLLRIDSLILLFSSSGTVFSLDRWIRRRRGGEGHEGLISPWPQRLLQLQLTYVYLSTVYLKCSGPTWVDGTALYYALRYQELKRFSFKFLFYSLWQIKLMTWAVMGGEFLMGTFVWVPKFRYPILAVAFLLHLGINLTMQFPVFQYIMLINLVLFVPPSDLERWGRVLTNAFKKRREVPPHRGEDLPLSSAS
jgi:Vitamin K-dependent gamma-carboxylase